MKRLALFIYRCFRFLSVSSAIWLDSYDYAKTKK